MRSYPEHLLRGAPALGCGRPEGFFGHSEPATLAQAGGCGWLCVWHARVFVCCDVFTSDFSGPSVSVFVYPSALSPRMWRKLLFSIGGQRNILLLHVVRWIGSDFPLDSPRLE